MSRGGGSLMDIDDFFGEMHCGTINYTPLSIKLPPPNPRSSSLEVLVAMHWESPLQPKFTTPSSIRTNQLSCFRLSLGRSCFSCYYGQDPPQLLAGILMSKIETGLGS